MTIEKRMVVGMVRYEMFCVYEPVYRIGLLAALSSLDAVGCQCSAMRILVTAQHLPHLLRSLDLLVANKPFSVPVCVHLIGPTVIADCASLAFAQHFTPAICYRLYVDRIVPQLDCPIVYFDLDMIWQCSPDQLFQAATVQSCLLAVPQEAPPEYVHRSGLENGTRYFNSGLMVLDFRRRDELTASLAEARRLLQVINAWSTYLDQDALNIAFAPTWSPLEWQWNVMTDMASRVNLELAGVLHASGSEKPWHFPNRHPFLQHYRKVLDRIGISSAGSYDVPASIARVRRRLVKVLQR